MCMSVYACEYRCFLRSQMMNPSAAGVTGVVVTFPVWALGVRLSFSLEAESSLLLNQLSSPKLDYS